MSGAGDDTADRIIARALASGPLDVLGVLRALRRDHEGALALHEGAVHALVHRLLKRGLVKAGGRSERGLTLYRAAEAPTPDAGAEPAIADEAPGGGGEDPVKVAGAVKDAGDRGRILADVRAHLVELEEAGQRHRFGSARAARALLQRVDGGKAAVLFTTGAGDAVRRLVVHEGPWLLCAVLVFFVLKLFVVSPFKIPSASMVPTLQQGDRVAVFTLFRSDVPDRWDVVVYKRGGINYVKRLVGLPGETLALWHGDAYANGALLVKPDKIRAALRSRVDTWTFGGDDVQGWRRAVSHDERRWSWAAGSFPPFEGPRGGFGAHDGYLELEGEVGERDGVALVFLRGPGDGEPRGVLWTLEAGPRGIVLSEEGAVDGEPADEARVLASSAGPAPTGRLKLGISYVDGVLRATCAGLTFAATHPAPDGPFSARVVRRGPGGGPLALTVDRDHHYAYGQGSTHGTPHPGAKGPQDFGREIPSDRIFCLGDNTTNSLDSRFAAVGDIPVADIIGPVSVRIWPPARWGLVR